MRHIAVAAALLALLAMTAPLWWFVMGAVTEPERVESRVFDAGLWKAAELADDGSSPRLGMVPSLVHLHLPIGTERAAVVELLGEPESERWSDCYPYPGWGIGQSPDSSDGTGLFIEFDGQGRVQAVYAPYWEGSETYDAGR